MIFFSFIISKQTANPGLEFIIMNRIIKDTCVLNAKFTKLLTTKGNQLCMETNIECKGVHTPKVHMTMTNP